MFKEWVGRKSNFVADPSADEIANRLSHRFPDQIQTGDFNGGIGSSGRIEWIFSRNKISLRAFRFSPAGFKGGAEQAGQSIRISPDYFRAERFNCLPWCFAAISFGYSDDTIFAF